MPSEWAEREAQARCGAHHVWCLHYSTGGCSCGQGKLLACVATALDAAHRRGERAMRERAEHALSALPQPTDLLQAILTVRALPLTGDDDGQAE